MEAESAPSAPARRLPPKMLIVGGGSALLLALIAGLLLWLWPASPQPKARKKEKAALHAVAPASAASAAEPVSAQAAEPDAEHGTVAAPPDAQASERHAPEPQAATPAASAAVAAAAPEPEPPRHGADEVPIDRLQRRLGEVLGARGAVNAAHPGEWRVTTRELAQPVAVAAHEAGGVPHVAWSYSGVDGPQAWGRLHPDFAACAKGQRQSPIDIRDGLALDLEPIRFDYHAGAFGVIDNGHTVQINVAPGSTIEVMGRRYALQQFHFHRPSEERIDGRRHEMSVHLVHRDAEGRLAVVAVLLDRGAAQPLLQTVWNNLPLEKHDELRPRAVLDPAELLPEDRRYYSYMGSLTTPPCSEGVLWLVLQRTLSASAGQIDLFARLYPMNARPIQPAAARLIKQSN